MSELEFRTELIEELSWGPGFITLIEPLEVEIETNPKNGFTTIYAESIQQGSDGHDYESALLNLGIAIEDFYTSFSETPRHVRDEHSQAIFDILVEHLPDDLVADTDR